MRIRILAAAIAVPCILSARENIVSIETVRSLGAQVAHVAERFDHGAVPTAAEMSKLNRGLMAANTAVADAGLAPAVRHKVAAVAARLQKLEYEIKQTPAPRASRARVDLETASATHGAACATALGISADHPVRLVLPASSDAWFFFPMDGAGLQRFWTVSSGPDPTLQVYDRCDAGAMPLVANDDSFGLDAEVAVAADQPRTVYVHVSNSGEAGAVTLATAAAPGTVNGTVKDGKTGQLISNAEVALYSTGGAFGAYGYAYTDQNGVYSIAAAQPGTYYVIANAQSYVTQMYPAGYCPFGIYYYNADCDTTLAHAVTVTATGSVSNINFSMSMGQKIFGQVRATDRTPVTGATVMLLQQNGQGVAQVNTDAAGHYSFSTLAPGWSYLVEGTGNGYGSQLYDHVACAGPTQTQCNLIAATPIKIASQDIVDIDFSLPRLSTITGHVTGSDARPLLNIQIIVVDQGGNYIAGGNTDAYGNYSAGPIGTGTYYVSATGGNVFSQTYPGIDCAAGCGPAVTGATPFTFTATGQTAQANFVLDYLPTLSGHVKDAASGLPLAGVQILLNTQSPANSGFSSIYATTDANGSYGVANVPIGNYFVWAQSSDHVDQVYSGVVCEALYYYATANCDVSGATLLSVTAGEQTVAPFDFALDASPSISGHAVVRAGTGSDLPAMVTVNVYDGTGESVGYASSDINGNYSVTDLAPGSYYAVAAAPYAGSYIGQIWQGIDCSPCVATTGTPIVLSAANPMSGIDFQLVRLDAVVGRVVDDRGAPIGGVVVDMFASGSNSYVGGAGTDANGFYMVSAPLGASYYLATEAGGGYTDQVYSGISCPNGTVYDHKCSLSGGTLVGLSSNATQPRIVNFALKPNDRVFQNGFD